MLSSEKLTRMRAAIACCGLVRDTLAVVMSQLADAERAPDDASADDLLRAAKRSAHNLQSLCAPLESAISNAAPPTPVTTNAPPSCACGAAATVALRGPGGSDCLCAACLGAFCGFASAMTEAANVKA